MEATEVRKLAELEGAHWWYRERRIILRDLVRRAFPDGVQGRRALDVGAAAGGNTVVLRNLGMMAVALEYGADGAALAHTRGLPVIRADAGRLPVADASVDLVTAFDVLEHIEDDLRAAKEAFRVLRTGGTLLVAVPADMSLWSAHDEAVGHVRRYERAGLVHLVESVGFEVTACFSWNVILRPIVRRARRSSSGSDLRPLPPLLNGSLQVILAVERRFSWLRTRPGVSLLLQAVKPQEPKRGS